MAKNTVAKTIDIKRNAGTGAIVTIGGGGGGVDHDLLPIRSFNLLIKLLP